MSFICQGCNKQQQKNTSPVQVTTLQRKVFYSERSERDYEGDRIITRGKGDGHEIVKELSVCSDCAPRLQARTVKQSKVVS